MKTFIIKDANDLANVNRAYLDGHTVKVFIYGDEPCEYCKGWGCSQCCANEEQIRARQGTFG